MPFFTLRTRFREPSRRTRQPAIIRAGLLIVVVALHAIIPAPTPAADLSPQLMARFTKHVQPLLLNKCAAGACHGGPSSHAPNFHRGDVSGRIDRGVTLANVEALFNAIGRDGNTALFLTTISARHPASSSAHSLSLVPLTTAERATLEQWLDAATGSRSPHASRTASATSPQTSGAPKPNRFRAMLDAAANPAPLPPPQEARGIILGKDSP